MSRLNWGAIGERFYESGVDRGVLYLDDQRGVAWPGLVSINESPTGGEAKPYYIDGFKYLNRATKEEFVGNIEAYTYPEEFTQYDGTSHVASGLFAKQQARKSFGMSYRSMIGNDTRGPSFAYKIHLLYNVLVAPSARSRQTMGDVVDPDNFSWPITTKAPLVEGYRPTSHFVIDSRHTPRSVLLELENILYGVDGVDARMPSIDELLYIFTSYTVTDIDGEGPVDPFYSTIDGGVIPTVQSTTIDGGAV